MFGTKTHTQTFDFAGGRNDVSSRHLGGYAWANRIDLSFCSTTKDGDDEKLELKLDHEQAKQLLVKLRNFVKESNPRKRK